MPQFLIVPSDQKFSSAQITSLDAASALHVVDRLACDEADVMEDGAYIFSVRKTGASGFWTIFQRDSEDDGPDAPGRPSAMG